MPTKRFTNEQIAFALRQAKNGTLVTEICRKMGVAEATFYRWKKVFFGITLPMIRTGALAGTAFAVLISFDEVALSLFLTCGNTLPLRLVQPIQYYTDPSVAAVPTMTTVASIAALFLAGLLLLLRRAGRKLA